MINPLEQLYQKYPDNLESKEVYVYIDSRSFGRERHVFIGWINHQDLGRLIVQQLHLTGDPGNYAFFPYYASILSNNSLSFEQNLSLGSFSRGQRDIMIDLSKSVSFDRKSIRENCQDWLKALLNLFHQNNLIESSIIEQINFRLPGKNE